MRIISRKKLREFWEQHPDARQPLQAWYDDVKHAVWKSPGDIRDAYRNASFVANNRVVFNIRGNRYRLVVAIQYEHGIVFIRFIGAHGEYDSIHAAIV
jgi:mRNA interferase HigB